MFVDCYDEACPDRRDEDLAARERAAVLDRLDGWVHDDRRHHVTIHARNRRPSLTYIVELRNGVIQPAGHGRGSSHDLALAVERALQDLVADPVVEEGAGG